MVLPSASGQKNTNPKYPSLFWEITGNGLKKPSYLFGTMHVSSKLVFHLSDSFYTAMKNVDAVALELNPELWQSQMAQLNKMKENYTGFIETPGEDYLMESSFRIPNYTDELKLALSSQPSVVNSLLYRSYKTREDFEEDTFLDLYIFQTGKKLGKRSSGVENYYETEKLVMEAYADMALEKRKKTEGADEETRSDITEKIQDAYRRGDLDLMDSLDLMLDASPAFRDKFIYQRNMIQANSMDTIMRYSSVFVGVGAAHLPGSRGVIELLRKKGYHLRPIRMLDRDAVQKDKINRIKVPAPFNAYTSDDGFYRVDIPGPLIKQHDEVQVLDRRQFADMANGSYYLVTRVKTHAAFLGQSEEEVLKKLDSLFYENIPGKIISKKKINRNGYSGFDLVNRTRRGDLQRNLILVTPFEVLFFKMNGPDNYVDGPEAERFFSSVSLKPADLSSGEFQPEQGGFSIRFPASPGIYKKENSPDGTGRWEYESLDKATGNAYLVFVKSIHHFGFLDEDSFDLRLMEESFRNPDHVSGNISRRPGTFEGYPCLEVTERMKDGAIVRARFIIRGPYYYLIASRINGGSDSTRIIESFRFTPFKYPPARNFTDTFMHFTVSTPVLPDLDEGIRSLIEKTNTLLETRNVNLGFAGYWPKAKKGLFKSPATGEMVGVTRQEYPKYYYISDPAKFWKGELDDYTMKNDLSLVSKDTLFREGQISGFRFQLRDTGSSRTIFRQIMLNDQYYYALVSMGDTVSGTGPFVNEFFNSFRPEPVKKEKSIYSNRLGLFFTDLFSSDSLVRSLARQSISNIYFGEEGIPGIMDAISRLKMTDKDYFESKVKLIAELGYIKDTLNRQVVPALKKIYESTGDTSLFHNEVFRALARHKTRESYALLKEYILQDPPVFESDYEYSGLFASLADSLALTKSLFPEILQLLTVSDYQDKLRSLLVSLVDSGLIKAPDYEGYYTKINFDAKLELKKQQAKEEKTLQKEMEKNEEEDLGGFEWFNNNEDLDEYAVLLMPFYEKNSNVRKFFDRLLYSRDQSVQLSTIILLLRHDKKVPDSLLQKLAASDIFGSRLYISLERWGRLTHFPAGYKNQLKLSRSLMLGEKKFDKADSVVFLYKQATSVGKEKGYVYFFKYRLKPGDEWKMGMSGLQPLDEQAVSSNCSLCLMSDKKLKPDEPVEEQFQKQLQRLQFSFHKSARNFYGYDEYYNRLKSTATYED